MCKNATDFVLEHLEDNPYITPYFDCIVRETKDDLYIYSINTIYKACRELHAQGKIRRIKIKGEKVSYGRLEIVVQPHFDALEAKEWPKLERTMYPLPELSFLRKEDEKKIIGLSWVEKFFNLFKR